MTPKIAILGAHTPAGRELLKVLSERIPEARDVVALAEGRAAGGSVSFGEDRVLRIEDLDRHDFRDTFLVLSALPALAAATHVPRAAAEGALVIDTSNRFRMEADVPLVVPELNPHALARMHRRRIVAVPEPVSTLLGLALKPLLALAKPRRLVVVTQQGASGAGKEAMDELFAQTRATYVNDPVTPEHFPKPIAFNVIPQVDRILAEGSTAEETRIGLELRKLLDPDLVVAATCIRVPVFLGQAVAVHAEFHAAIQPAAARAAWASDGSVTVIDRREDGGYITPLEVPGEAQVFISRIRSDPGVPHGLAFWAAADDLHRGVALSAIGIAETLLRHGLPSPPPAAAGESQAITAP